MLGQVTRTTMPTNTHSSYREANLSPHKRLQILIRITSGLQWLIHPMRKKKGWKSSENYSIYDNSLKHWPYLTLIINALSGVSEVKIHLLLVIRKLGSNKYLFTDASIQQPGTSRVVKSWFMYEQESTGSISSHQV